MSSEAIESLSRSLYEALARKDFEGAIEHLADGCLALNVATGDVYRGQDGFLEFFRGWAAAFPDLRMEMVKTAAGERRAVIEYELEGTHTGPLVTPRGHVPPTGMPVQLSICDVLETDDGRVTHLRSYFDSISLLRQLGLLNGSPLHTRERRAALELYAQPLDMGAPERHKAIVHRYLQNVFNRQDPGAAADTCDRSFTWHGGPLGQARGLPAFQKMLEEVFVAFPDLDVQILDTIAEGDRVVVRLTLSGTHLGPFRGIAPTRRHIEGDATNTFRLENSRIVEEWWQGDVLAVLRQMDAVPAAVKPG